jgi:hypothetical protein
MIELATQLLPFGDAGYGLWLRQGDAKRRGPDAAARPSRPSPKGSPTPSGIKPGALPEISAKGERPADPEAAPTAASAAGAAPAAPTVPRPDARPQEPAPASAPSGDRDTPTEMYVKGVHGAAPSTSAPPESPPAARKPVAPRPERPDIEIAGDRDTPTRAMEVIPKPMGLPAGADDFLLTQPPRAPTGHGPAVSVQVAPAAPPAVHTPNPDTRHAFPSNPFGVPQAGSAQASGPQSALPIEQSSAFPGLRPRWQEKLDRALNRVGGFLERVVSGIGNRFRAASPRAQIVIVVAVAALFAAIVVLTIWLLMR